MTTYLDNLLTKYEIFRVKDNSSVKFLKDEANCPLYNFMNRLDNTSSLDNSLVAELCTISSEDIDCFTKRATNQELVKNKIEIIKTSKTNTASYLNLLNLKWVERALLFKLSQGTKGAYHNELVSVLQSLLDNKLNQGIYQRLRMITALPQSDLVLEDLRLTIKHYKYNDYHNSDKVQYALYRFYYNDMIRDLRAYIMVWQSYYYTQKDIDDINILKWNCINDRYNLNFHTTKKDIKQLLEQVIPYFYSLYKALKVYKATPVIESGNLVQSFNIDFNLLFGSIDSQLISQSKTILEPNISISANEIVTALLNIIDSNQILIKLRLDKQRDTVQELTIANSKISELNNTNPSEVSAGQLDEIDNLTFSVKQSLIRTDTNNKNSGSNLLYGSKAVQGLRDMRTYLESANNSYKQYLQDITNKLNDNKVHITASVGAILGLQDFLDGLYDDQKAFRDKIQANLDLVSDVVDDLKQSLCIISNMICFLTTLDKRVALTGEEIVKQGQGYLKAYNETKQQVLDMYVGFKTSMDSASKKELSKQIKRIVEPKVITKASVVDSSKYIQVQEALRLAVEDTIDIATSQSQSLIEDLKNSMQTSADSFADSVVSSAKESVDITRCRIEPLFDIPQMLTWELEPLRFGQNLLNLNFKLSNCKDN